MPSTYTAGYASLQAATRPPLQSTRVPMDPRVRRPAAPRLTDRELLEKQAKSRNAMAACEAQVSAPYFSVRSFDPYTNTAQIVKMGEASVVHTIDLNTGECDCRLQESVTKINGKLVAERSDTRCIVKCRRIIDHLEIFDPHCLANAPHPCQLAEQVADPSELPELLVANATEAI